jgi:hypothetical protein
VRPGLAGRMSSVGSFKRGPPVGYMLADAYDPTLASYQHEMECIGAGAGPPQWRAASAVTTEPKGKT